LLGLIHAAVPFAPPLSSFECAEQRRFLDDGVLIRIADATFRLTKSSDPLARQFQDWRQGVNGRMAPMGILQIRGEQAGVVGGHLCRLVTEDPLQHEAVAARL
jgi:hypothetical protein